MSVRADSQVAAEAREWFVRLLDEDVSAEELGRWQGWLARSPAHRAAYDRVTDAWSLGGEGRAASPSLAERAADAYDGSIPVAAWKRPRPVRRFRPSLIAASLAVAVLGGSAVLLNAPAGEAQAITTMRAEHKESVLADGSKVEVGAMTGVQVRISDDRRDVKLDKGEAFFRVAPDPQRPFVVKTPFGAVTAAGTAFNVDVGADQICITVSEGSVIVRPSGLFAKPVRVEAGQRLIADADGVMVAAAPAPVTWTQGRLEYRGEPLRAVIEDVNRYAERPVVLRDPAVGELAYTGTVRLDAAADWARGLPAAFPLTVSAGEGGVTVISSRQ
ncbi:MAG TPA: FecR domain-containing protein [Caulobacteraceae bacterium]|nr:FecR domain-containing protein [Caulobacteraceae bacterium]